MEKRSFDYQSIWCTESHTGKSYMIISSPGPKAHKRYCHHCISGSLHSLTFHISSFSHKPLNQLEPVLAEMVPGWSSICYMIINSFGFKMAAMPVMLSDWLNF